MIGKYDIGTGTLWERKHLFWWSERGHVEAQSHPPKSCSYIGVYKHRSDKEVVLEVIARIDPITAEDLASELGIDSKTAASRLSYMCDLGILRRRGTIPTGRGPRTVYEATTQH